VFVVGRARLEADLAGVKDDVGQVVQKVRGLLGGGEVVVEQSRVRVDRRLCALCLTCVRVCPEGAMGFTDRRPASNPLVCTACGTCAAECPMDAIQILGDEDARYGTEIEAAGAPDKDATSEALDEEARILVFLCRNSAARAVEAARLKGLAWPEGASFIEVPCAGKLDPIYVLDAFRAGFDGVLILSCFPDACYSLEGSTWAGHRLVHLQNLLAEAGQDPRRLAQQGVAPVMSSEALAWVEQMKRDVAALGPNPLKAAARTREYLRRFTRAMDDSFTLQAQASAGV
jgi:quinone-modifying oxidoreductase subunit QmoB